MHPVELIACVAFTTARDTGFRQAFSRSDMDKRVRVQPCVFQIARSDRLAQIYSLHVNLCKDRYKAKTHRNNPHAAMSAIPELDFDRGKQ